jgi:hypothetical protein
MIAIAQLMSAPFRSLGKTSVGHSFTWKSFQAFGDFDVPDA